MSRTTQYIGLNKKAIDFVRDLVPVVPSSNHTTGMFEEEIPLGEWLWIERRPTGRWTSKNGGELEQEFEEHTWLVREEEQVVPWSSGPMIFTCLALYFGQERIDTPDRFNGGEDHGPLARCFEWTLNPTLPSRGMECDYTTGEYWV